MDNYNYTVFYSIVHIVFNYNFRKMILCHCVMMMHHLSAINLIQVLFYPSNAAALYSGV